MLRAMSTPLVDRARRIAPELRGHRAAHDRARQLDPAVVTLLREGGFLGALAPRELGGDELPPADYVELLEALAAGDAAAAWCVMTATTTSLLLAYLPRAAAAAMWPPGAPPPFLSGVFAPGGKLADGRLSGRWSYASGSRHADGFFVGALAGKRHVVCAVPPQAVTIADNWDTLGLAGTGSHDLVIEEAEVAPDRVTSVFERAPWSDAALYRVPLFGLLSAGIAGCGLGIARAALHHAAGRLAADAPSLALVRYGELRAQLDAARAYLRATAAAVAAAAAAAGPGGAIGDAARGELRLASRFVAQTCAEVARGAFHLGGGASARTGSPLGEALRDAETLLTHRMVAERVLPAAARAVLGLGAAPPDL